MLPAISQPGITIVIVPILALISDQLERCQHKHIPAAALYGGLPEAHKEQVLHDLGLLSCPFKLLYTTPEFLVEDKKLQDIFRSFSSTGHLQRFSISRQYTGNIMPHLLC